MDRARPSLTLGKRVTLFGAVLTDVGPANVNGARDEAVRRMQDKNGEVHLVLRDVVEEAPETLHRSSFGWRP